jgi:signal transduction histidine kinase
MNAAAAELAGGNYDASFRGDGCLETRELAATLNYASSELSKTDHLQKELIANISHDLRTPLTMIRGYGEVMRDIPEENTPENVQVIIDEAARLSELVSDLLDISKLQAGTRALTPERFDLTATMREVMQRYEKLTAHDGYTIAFSEQGEAEILADRQMILQVVYNIINNAINHAGPGKHVWVEQTVEDGFVRIRVQDDGPGIQPTQIPLIWDRYYKVDKIHRRAMVGTGLGLSIVKEILELHYASYGVESALGHGSVFWFALPLAEREETEPEAGAETEHGGTK